MKALQAMERPVSALTNPAPITTSRQAARNSPRLGPATERIIGRSTSRPAASKATTPSTAGARSSSRFGDRGCRGD